jgi:hypothetical protein
MTDWTAAGAFAKDPGFDFDARCALGAAATGIGDIGLVLATLNRIGEPTPQTWFDEWSATAGALAKRAEVDAATGRDDSARWAYLAAAQYYATALGSVDGLADQSVLGPTFAEHRRCWDCYVDAHDGAVVRVAVPYEGTTLPGYLLRPDASGGKRPTLIITNGSDGSISVAMAFGGFDALKRGWNVFLYDGPGQQSMLFQRGMPFRYDWETVLTPVVDTLLARDDVDANKMVGYGLSQGGYWLPRALAFEHRLAAAVVDPGVMDVSTSWVQYLPPPMIELLDNGDKDTFDGYLAQGSNPETARTFAFRARPYGDQDPFDLFTDVRRYNLRDVVGQINTPLLITAPEDEQFWPTQSRELFDALTGPKDLLEFTRQQGANWHCEPLGRWLTNLQTLDWLESRLAAADAAPVPPVGPIPAS